MHLFARDALVLLLKKFHKEIIKNNVESTKKMFYHKKVFFFFCNFCCIQISPILLKKESETFHNIIYSQLCLPESPSAMHEQIP